MRHYATLFDSAYLVKGLILYESLAKHSSEPFRLHVLAMDSQTAATLRGMDLPNMLVTDLETFEICQWEMVNARQNRSWLEYLWTCGSNFTLFVMNQLGEEPTAVTYLDADLMFFSDPKVIFDEIGDRSIAVIPHRLIPSKKHLEANGKFNVSFVYFRNDRHGKQCLDRWAEQCRRQCSEKVGCGDQLYLNEFPLLWPHDCHVIENIGAGLAPWNLAHYYPLFNRTANRLDLMNGSDNRIEPVVFYHYHEFQEQPEGFRLTNYDLRQEDADLVYQPYVNAYIAMKEKLQAVSQ